MVRTGKLLCWGYALIGLALMAATSHGQRGGGGGPGGGGGFGMFGGGVGNFAGRSDVQKELDLNDDQIGKIASITEDAQQEVRDAMREAFANFRDMGDEERAEAMTKFNKLNGEVRDKVLAELSATQKQRFTELEFQYNLQRNASQALTTAGIEIKNGDKEELETALSEVERKVNEKVAEMRLEMQKEALAKFLGGDKLDALIGKVFTFESRGGGGRFGGGGGGGRARDAAGDSSSRPSRPSDDAAPTNRRRGN